MPREFYKPVKNLVISFTYIQLFAYIWFSGKQSMLVVVGLMKYKFSFFYGSSYWWIDGYYYIFYFKWMSAVSSEIAAAMVTFDHFAYI